jgi:arylsulfatase A-like enzyme
MKYLLALYDSEIAFTDEYIGKVFDELKRLQLYDNTIVIVTADHGEEFMERGSIGHTITVYEELIHVPLIVKLPGCKPRTIEKHVGLIDVMPTVLSVLGLDVPQGLDGRVLDLGSPDRIQSRPVFSETLNNTRPVPGDFDPLALRAIDLNGRKLIWDEVSGSKELYELPADPDEKKNLLSSPGADKGELERLLTEWIDYVKSKQPEVRTEDKENLFTPEQIKQLKSIGYL